MASNEPMHATIEGGNLETVPSQECLHPAVFPIVTAVGKLHHYSGFDLFDV
jgi:hypothetical protein